MARQLSDEEKRKLLKTIYHALLYLNGLSLERGLIGEPTDKEMANQIPNKMKSRR